MFLSKKNECLKYLYLWYIVVAIDSISFKIVTFIYDKRFQNIILIPLFSFRADLIAPDRILIIRIV